MGARSRRRRGGERSSPEGDIGRSYERPKIRSVLDTLSILFSWPPYTTWGAAAQTDPVQASAGAIQQTAVPEVTGYDVELHEYPVVRGRTGKLAAHIIHHDFDDLHHYFDRHNIYSDWEALLRTRYRDRDRSGEIKGRIFGSATERRRFAKRLFLGLPGKPVIYFLYSYVLHAGFLDGHEGFAFNILKAFYWYQISLKEYEIRKAQAAAGQASNRVQGVPRKGGPSV